jgi:hypothetical protein
VYHHFFFSKGCACNVCDWPCLPSLWLGSHNDCSLIKVWAGSGVPPSSFQTTVLLMSLLSFWRLAPPQCPVTKFPKPDGKFNCSLQDLQSNGLIKWLLAPQMQLPYQALVSYAIAAFMSRLTSLLKRPSFNGSAYLCLVYDDCVPCAMQEQCGGSPILGQWPNSAGSHHWPGSISSAVGGVLRLNASPILVHQ